MTKKKQSFIEGALVLTIAAVIVKIIGALYRIPLTDAIGEDGMGYYSTAYNFYLTIYSVAVSGFPTAIARLVANYSARGRYKDVKRVVSVARVMLIALGIVSTLLLILLAKPYVNWVKNPRAYYCILAVAPSIIFSCLMATHRGYHQGMSNMSPTAMSQVIEVLFKAVGGLAGAYMMKAHFTGEYLAGGTVFGTTMATDSEAQVTILSLAAAGAIFGVSLSTMAGYLYLFFSRVGGKGDGITAAMLQASPDAHTDKHILKQLLRIGVPIALSSITVTLTGLIDNISVLSRLNLVVEQSAAALFASHGGILELAEKQLADIPNYLYGVYNMGVPIFNLVPAVTGSFGMSVLPHVTTAWTVGDREKTKRYLESALRITALIAAPCGMGIAFLSGPIAKLIYSSRPVGAELLGGAILSTLGVAAIFVALVGSLNALLQAVGRVDVPMKLMLLGGGIKLVCNYVLVAIPNLNIRAAAMGNLMCYLTITAASFLVLKRTTNIRVNFTSVLVKPMLGGLLTGSFALLAYNILSRALSVSDKLVTVVSIGVGAAVYVVSVSVMKAIEREDIEELPGGKKIVNLLEKFRVIR